jgi:hypothetical protein
MRFRLYKQFGALNSQPVFAAFEKGLKQLGHQPVQEQEDVAVIWSVLWQGRMLENQKVYRKAIKSNTPVIIIEVGNLRRGTTWRISVNHINGLGHFGNDIELDQQRSHKIGVSLLPIQLSRRPEILIACQHSHSLQWEGMPAMAEWVKETVSKVKQYTDKSIVVRPHPRSPIPLNIPGVRIEVPKKLPQTYDDFDIDYRYHCVINYNSGPAVQAAIQGIPVICDTSSLAYPISANFENIETISLPAREEWFNRLCHTEWTVGEIAQGIPLQRLMPQLEHLKNS